MRPKKVFSKISQDVKQIDIERIKRKNPKLWKKLKKQYDTGRKIVEIQLYNGLDQTNEKTLRYYLMEFTSRFLKFGPKSLPISFNVLEPFFVFNYYNSIIHLHSEEESYGISLINFLDFVTSNDFDLKKIDFYENISENVIYHFSFTSDFDQINFSNNDKTFVIGSLSLVRQGNEVSLLMQAGESYDKQQAQKYLKNLEGSLNSFSINPSKKALGFLPENKEERRIVNYCDREDLWAHNIGVLFDLNDKSIDMRFVARDENSCFKMFTDDFFGIFQSQKKLTNEQIKVYFKNCLKELSVYDAVFDFAKYCLALPYYVFEKEKRIVAVTYETNLKSLIKSPFSKKKYSSVPSEFKIYAKPLYYLESSKLSVIKNDKLNDQSFKIEKSGYWKRLDANEEGFDKKGTKIIGKTWVERNDIFYTTPKGITQVKKIELFTGKNAGYIYIMRQPSHEENIFKIGLTRRTPEQRRAELSNTSSVDKFFIISSYQTKDCVEAEKQIHHELDIYRLTSRREFFHCDLKVIMETCEKIISKINEKALQP